MDDSQTQDVRANVIYIESDAEHLESITDNDGNEDNKQQEPGSKDNEMGETGTTQQKTSAAMAVLQNDAVGAYGMTTGP